MDEISELEIFVSPVRGINHGWQFLRANQIGEGKTPIRGGNPSAKSDFGPDQTGLVIE